MSLVNWGYVAIAIVAEVTGTVALGKSEQFTRLWPTVVIALGYGIAFYMMSLALRTIPLGTVYAVWASIGIVLTSLIGVYYYKNPVDWQGLTGIAFIVAGVVIIKAFSAMAGG